MKHRIRVLSTLALLLFSSAVHAQPNDSWAAAVNAVVADAMRAQPIPGAAVAVIRNGDVVTLSGYGAADLESQTPVTPDTLFESGSLSKVFWMIAVMQLVEAGDVTLDAPITAYLADAPAAWNTITVRHLLTHAGGLPRVPTGEAGTCAAPPGDMAWYAGLRDLPLTFEPGTRREYSDAGFQLLALIVERVSGLPRADYLRERIFEPAGMTSAQMISGASETPNLATGYQVIDGAVTEQPCIDQAQDLDLYVSLNDLVAWEAALRSGLLLHAETLEQTFDDALAWSLAASESGRVATHGGGSGGFTNRLLIYPDADAAVIVLTNLRLANALGIAQQAAAIDPALALSADGQAAIDPEPEITALALDVLRRMRGGTLPREQLTPDLQAVYEDILALAPDLQMLGEPNTFTLIEQADEGGVRVYRYRADFWLGSGTFTLGLAADGRIALLDLGL